jgi:competence protein ComEC
MTLKSIFLTACLLAFSVSISAQGNGKLQIHFMDVGQGDGAILISPSGHTVLFDNGVWGNCQKPMAYLKKLGIQQIDFMITSHYHADHFGCTQEVLSKYPLTNLAIDRGGTYKSPMFDAYVNAVGDKRRTVTNVTTITMDTDSAFPVKINIAAFNGAGIKTTNENDLSIAAVIHFGDFDVMMAGDLSGVDTENYQDIETTVAKVVGQVEVYKVNHHGSEYSSNTAWLKTLAPRVAAISTGDGNKHGHPTSVCLNRLHHAKIEKTYWTEEGNGVKPENGLDVVAHGSILMQVAPGAANFTVTYGSQTDTYPLWPGAYKGKR